MAADVILFREIALAAFFFQNKSGGQTDDYSTGRKIQTSRVSTVS